VAPTRIVSAATSIEWELIKGDSFDLLLPILDGAEQAVDITGWTAKAQVRRSSADPVLHEWTTVATVATPTPNAEISGSTLTLHVDGVVTSAWGWSDARVSVEITEPGGRAHTVAIGVLRARQEITQ
jgi:hypothetical protein